MQNTVPARIREEPRKRNNMTSQEQYWEEATVQYHREIFGLAEQLCKKGIVDCRREKPRPPFHNALALGIWLAKAIRRATILLNNAPEEVKEKSDLWRSDVAYVERINRVWKGIEKAITKQVHISMGIKVPEPSRYRPGIHALDAIRNEKQKEKQPVKSEKYRTWESIPEVKHFVEEIEHADDEKTIARALRDIDWAAVGTTMFFREKKYKNNKLVSTDAFYFEVKDVKITRVYAKDRNYPLVDSQIAQKNIPKVLDNIRELIRRNNNNNNTH
jgi:hypothetical protein